MIDYEILEPQVFIKRVEAIEKMIDEGWIQFKPDCIRMVGLDPSRIAVFEFVAGEDMVTIHESDEMSLPINFFDMCKVLVRMKTAETLRLQYDGSFFKLIGKIDNRKKTFNLPLIDITEVEEPPMDHLLSMPLKVTFFVDVTSLKDMIEDCAIFSDTLTVTTKTDRVIMGAIYFGSANVISEIEVEDVHEDELTSYAIRFLKIAVDCMIGEKVLVRFQSNYPMLILNKISELSRMVFFLAPRVEESDFPDDDD